jgi:hypothetical protein
MANRTSVTDDPATTVGPGSMGGAPSGEQAGFAVNRAGLQGR